MASQVVLFETERKLRLAQAQRVRLALIEEFLANFAARVDELRKDRAKLNQMIAEAEVADDALVL